ncbi:hypothetical protein P175DRAFT_0514074 [Aspergillus ochraceoroseus IBT 24754]|uniref:RING-type domain-containing protein n=1 Tax=Aspergillus ochraceoroseus IBT 24754 TaxID=1392256 RepID=A0A2T5M9W6_9EURO|nr:uncharacterized protein P175DRAFT_0514074 [Aspergillus ochraceoroseus IBT 24754]PTU25320.1 hypothetical protein P175DRAFT_0514074 [Aspergillus ochraceoroseus IBT 24754]
MMDTFSSRPEVYTRTTLLVVPTHLVKHWKDQLRVHCHSDHIGEVVEYHAQARLSTLDDTKSLQKFRIVITTYDEVRRSYPKFRPPKNVTDENVLSELWEAEYSQKIGPLHRIKFERIVLDEAHLIRNRASSISIAIRGLTGHYKWLLTGTPILNSIDEFYPLFHFLDVPRIGTSQDFLSKYCSTDEGQDRLRNLLRSFMHRRTHSSRLFSLPIISLPDVEQKVVRVRFCEAERILYNAIMEIYFDNINDQAKVRNSKGAQQGCFLTMILKLRMFCDHPLTVRTIIRDLLSEPLMRKLTIASREEGDDSSGPSFKLVQWIRGFKDNYNFSVEHRPRDEQDNARDIQVFTYNPELIRKFRQFMEQLHNNGDWIERAYRGVCSYCNLEPDKTVVTSCMHLYCEECFYTLHEEAEKSESGKPQCLKCRDSIFEATRCGPAEEAELEHPSVPEGRQSETSSSRKKRNNIRGKSNPENDRGKVDWMIECGASMPSAKLTGIRNTIKDWKMVNSDAKVVIFSQFTDFIQILIDMCTDKNWGYCCVCTCLITVSDYLTPGPT